MDYSFIEIFILMAAITMMITGLYFLIRDMDDPFEVECGGCADVDMFLILDLDKYLTD